MGNVYKANCYSKSYEYPFTEVTAKELIPKVAPGIADEAMMTAIIHSLEKEASQNIRKMKCVQLPYIGCIRINPVKRKLRDESLSFRAARKNMSKEQYKEHVRAWVNDIKERQRKIDNNKVYMTKIRRNNKDKYEQMCINIGRAYGDMYLYSLTLLSIVEFDEEWERQYQLLKD